MSADDRLRWDERYRASRPRSRPGPGPRAVLLEAASHLPDGGRALDLACGEGPAAVWLAQRSFTVDAVDISPVALATLTSAAEGAGVAGRIRAIAADLDDGLPEACRTVSYDVVVCLHFRTPLLGEVLQRNLRPGGVVVASVLSRVGRGEGRPEGRIRFLAAPGELAESVRDGWEILLDREGDGEAAVVARKLA